MKEEYFDDNFRKIFSIKLILWVFIRSALVMNK